ncbi:hypothetical protein DFH28DRAFT_1131521 [Melampsora americana]|nr:hypothetical protein DFH28DRAFT_1131521 [Melampsora americana]
MAPSRQPRIKNTQSQPQPYPLNASNSQNGINTRTTRNKRSQPTSLQGNTKSIRKSLAKVNNPIALQSELASNGLESISRNKLSQPTHPQGDINSNRNLPAKVNNPIPPQASNSCEQIPENLDQASSPRAYHSSSLISIAEDNSEHEESKQEFNSKDDEQEGVEENEQEDTIDLPNFEHNSGTNITHQLESSLNEPHLKVACNLGNIDNQPEQSINFGLFQARIHQDLINVQDQTRKSLKNEIEQIKVDIKSELSEIKSEMAGQLQHQAHSPESSQGPSHTESSSSKEVVPWVPSKSFKDFVRAMASKHVIEPHIEGYTAIIGPDTKKPLKNSLYKLIKARQQGPDWTSQHLPKKVQGFVLADDAQGVSRYIKEKAKHARENLHLVVRRLNLFQTYSSITSSPLTLIILQLLTGIKPPRKSGESTPAIPDLCELIDSIAALCKKDDDFQTARERYKGTKILPRARYTYLVSNTFKGFSKSVWEAVDNQLAKLRQEGKQYTSSFYNIIYKEDREMFDGGKRMYEEFPKDTTFDMPLDEEIRSKIQELRTHAQRN